MSSTTKSVTTPILVGMQTETRDLVVAVDSGNETCTVYRAADGQLRQVAWNDVVVSESSPLTFGAALGYAAGQNHLYIGPGDKLERVLNVILRRVDEQRVVARWNRDLEPEVNLVRELWWYLRRLEAHGRTWSDFMSALMSVPTGGVTETSLSDVDLSDTEDHEE